MRPIGLALMVAGTLTLASPFVWPPAEDAAGPTPAQPGAADLRCAVYVKSDTLPVELLLDGRPCGSLHEGRRETTIDVAEGDRVLEARQTGHSYVRPFRVTAERPRSAVLIPDKTAWPPSLPSSPHAAPAQAMPEVGRWGTVRWGALALGAVLILLGLVFFNWRVPVDPNPSVNPILALFEQLNPRDQVNRILVLLNMPEGDRPPSTLSPKDRETEVIRWAQREPRGLKTLTAILKEMLREQHAQRHRRSDLD